MIKKTNEQRISNLEEAIKLIDGLLADKREEIRLIDSLKEAKKQLEIAKKFPTKEAQEDNYEPEYDEMEETEKLSQEQLNDLLKQNPPTGTRLPLDDTSTQYVPIY